MNIRAVAGANGVNLTVTEGHETSGLESFHTSSRDSNMRRAEMGIEGFIFCKYETKNLKQNFMFPFENVSKNFISILY